jgi:hypothetical protein
VAASTPSFRIEPLSDRHRRTDFNSGVEAFDRYLLQQVSQDVRRHVASCFVLIADEQPSPLGYYTLAATSILLSDLPTPVAKKLPRYPKIPATLLGRLAIDVRQQGHRYGELLLFDAFSRTLRSEIGTYALVVQAKDDKAASFYRHYGFLPLGSDSRHLFAPIAEIAKLFT